jgi:hypothetical protein
MWFWRDSSGNEIDLIIQDGIKLQIIEFKASQTIMPEIFKGLNYFEKLSGKDNISKTLVYGGKKSRTLSDGEVISWKNVL